MTDKKYCDGLDCALCNENEPCIYRIANILQEQLKRKEQECDSYKQALDEIEEALIPVCDSCRKYYSNQHCEECDNGYIKEIIDKVKNN